MPKSASASAARSSLLTDLPPGTDDTVKKQIVMASLRAFNVPVEKIIESGAQELQALEAYIRAGAADVEKVTTEADQRIKQYEEEIGKLKIVMQQRVEEQNKVMASCNSKKLEVQKVLEFFGQEAVAQGRPRIAEAPGTFPLDRERTDSHGCDFPHCQSLERFSLDLDLGHREGASGDRLRKRHQLDGRRSTRVSRAPRPPSSGAARRSTSAIKPPRRSSRRPRPS